MSAAQRGRTSTSFLRSGMRSRISALRAKQGKVERRDVLQHFPVSPMGKRAMSSNTAVVVLHSDNTVVRHTSSSQGRPRRKNLQQLPLLLMSAVKRAVPRL